MSVCNSYKYYIEFQKEKRVNFLCDLSRIVRFKPVQVAHSEEDALLCKLSQLTMSTHFSAFSCCLEGRDIFGQVYFSLFSEVYYITVHRWNHTVCGLWCYCIIPV